jgi:hypothetical protein
LDPGYKIRKKLIPDPGSRESKRHRIPHPGSATLQKYKHWENLVKGTRKNIEKDTK